MKLYRAFTTQQEIDAAYDVEASVPDFQRYAEFFTNESARARADLKCVLDVRFGPTLAEYMDIFPAKEPGAPLLIFIHGGYWRMLSAKEFSFVARGPVARGCTVAVTNYALCPHVTISEITRQTRAAIAFLTQEAERFNADPERIVVSGHSAGGQQSVMAALTDWPGEYGLGADTVKGAVPISGLFDLSPFPFSWLAPALRLDHPTIVEQSPLFHIPPVAPPLVVAVGGAETDEFLRQSADFLSAWQEAGLRGRSLIEPGLNHFTAIEGFMHAESTLTDTVMAFIGEQAPPRSAPVARDVPAEQTPGPRSTEPARKHFPTHGAMKQRLSFERQR